MNIRNRAVAVAIAFSSLLNSGTINSLRTNQDGLSAETISFYNEWKEKYLEINPYTDDETQYYVWYSEEKYADVNSQVEVTVSEAHGYGMLIAACMAEYDGESKEIFDGMYRFYKAHTSEIGPNLMAWQQVDNGTAIVNSSGADSATDGDMDIAYALLLADTIWGSDGEINYKQSAVSIINDIMEYEVNKTDWILQLGDWVYWSDESDPYYAATRASDFIVQYMPVFAEAANDERWLNVYQSTYDIINSFTAEYGTGILPDFIVKDANTGKFVAAPANFLESDYDGYYYYNSCRTPWRISMDYLVNQNKDALTFADTINTFIKNSTNNDPWEIKAGYKPDGTPVENYDDLCFIAPFMIAAACDTNTEWHDSIRDTVINYGEDVYYGDTIKMFCLIADDGCWLIPECNESIVYTIQDVKNLQDFLLTRPTEEDLSRKPYDLNDDGVWDVFDLCLMKREILNQ